MTVGTVLCKNLCTKCNKVTDHTSSTISTGDEHITNVYNIYHCVECRQRNELVLGVYSGYWIKYVNNEEYLANYQNEPNPHNLRDVHGCFDCEHVVRFYEMSVNPTDSVFPKCSKNVKKHCNHDENVICDLWSDES